MSVNTDELLAAYDLPYKVTTPIGIVHYAEYDFMGDTAAPIFRIQITEKDGGVTLSDGNTYFTEFNYGCHLYWNAFIGLQVQRSGKNLCYPIRSRKTPKTLNPLIRMGGPIGKELDEALLQVYFNGGFEINTVYPVSLVMEIRTKAAEVESLIQAKLQLAEKEKETRKELHEIIDASGVLAGDFRADWAALRTTHEFLPELKIKFPN